MDKESEVWEFHNVARSGLARMQRRHAIDDGDPLWIGDYGHTWATVGELLDLPWNETMTDFGDESLNRPMSQQCDYFVQWLNVLNDWWGRDNCRVIWGFDS